MVPVEASSTHSRPHRGPTRADQDCATSVSTRGGMGTLDEGPPRGAVAAEGRSAHRDLARAPGHVANA